MKNANEPRFYTKKMREIALNNAKTYDWAKKLVQKACEEADALLPYVDKLHDLITVEGIPRSYTMSTVEAPNHIKWNCPYCGKNIRIESVNGWHVDAKITPWKVTCPMCDSKFPSNDFALLYNRGINEKGEYDRDLAIKNNAEAVARGEKDALKNELFPDKDELWMVDDGFGWDPEAGTYGTMSTAKWAPVAYYNNDFWYIHREKTNTSLIKIITVLRDAYLYTSDEKYGLAGAKLLNRVADVYPNYDVRKISLGYSLSHGMGYNGKITGNIREHFVAEYFLRAYDAFYPVCTDAQRANMQENIVAETWRAVRDGAIYGNFAMHQKVAALCAVLLEDEKKSDEILEWLLSPSDLIAGDGRRVPYTDPIYGKTYQMRDDIRGGELYDKFINEIDHDGFGWEESMNYNKFWFFYALDVAEVLTCVPNNKLDLFKNPKFVKMFDTFIHETIANGKSIELGDSFYAVSVMLPMDKEMLRGYKVLKDPKLAQYYHYYVNGDLSNTYIDMFSDPAELKASIEKDIETYGPHNFESENLTGFGFTLLREGQPKFDEKQYDTWMYYGRTVHSHPHRDMLQMGIDAYGLNLMPDLGYPEATGYQANRYEWVKATISHNTVVVNGDSQTEQWTGRGLHFDSTDQVKLVDVDGSVAYDETDIYRRSIVTVAVDEEVGYTLDFFRVKGGDDHMYSFHAQSYMGYESDDVKWVPQVDADGNYVGTYASPDFEYGHDPNSTDTMRAEQTFYPRGYTWLTHVNKGTVENGTFTVDFAITDFRNHAKDGEGVHLRFTALNDWIPTGVDMTTGYPPRKNENEVIPGLDYMFVNRKGENLDTLYTTLLQPYRHEAYIAKAEAIAVAKVAGTECADDVVKALKITHTNGLCDYVVYATNNTVTYEIADGDKKLAFRGFVGVYRVNAAGEKVYAYVNDGDLFGEATGVAAYTGAVVNFTKEIAFENEIEVRFEQAVDVDAIVGRYVYVENAANPNSVYRIQSAAVKGENVVLQLGNTTLVAELVDRYHPEEGFVYSIEEGGKVRIPLSYIK